MFHCTDRLAVIALVSACTPAPVVPVAPVAPTAWTAPAPPALFAELVRPTATWTFTGETRNVEGTDRNTVTGQVTCTASGRTIRQGWATEIACSGMSHANLVDGTYVITRAGMWQVIDELTDDMRLPVDQMLIAAVPAPIERQTEDDQYGYKIGEAWKTQAHGDAWCISHDDWGGEHVGGVVAAAEAGLDHRDLDLRLGEGDERGGRQQLDDWGGDEGGWALCIQAGKGIVGGSGYFAGGFTHDTFFGDVPGY